jgi:hypothetical protein
MPTVVGAPLDGDGALRGNFRTWYRLVTPRLNLQVKIRIAGSLPTTVDMEEKVR